MDNKYDVFISYSRHDTTVVNEFVERLEREGFNVWIDRDGIESGDAFKRIILQAIKNSAVVLFFSSQFSNQSGWTAKEIGVAVKYKKPVIPILLDDSNFNEEVEFDLINLDFIDYQDVSVRGTMMDRLVKSLKAKIPNLIGQMKAEAAERERLERERWQKAEAEQKAREEAERKTKEEAMRKAKEETEREVREQQESVINHTPQKNYLPWIIGGLIVAFIVLLVVLSQQKKEIVLSSDGSFNGHEYVDLDLPSGTLWATCNIGADMPNDYGDYYAWGETTKKSTYNCDTYKYVNGDSRMLTKYCTKSYFGNNGFTDTLTILQSSDDPAVAIWGGGWRTPSKKQWDELLANTTNQWTTQDDVAGRLFTSKKSRKTLFLPAAGYRWDEDNTIVATPINDEGEYWSSSLDTDHPSNAWMFSFFELDYAYEIYWSTRCTGFSVRAVRSTR